MLNLRLAKETNGGLVGGTPEFLLGQVQGIEELDSRVELASKCLKIGLGLRESRGCLGNRGGGESGGRRDKGSEDSGLHDEIKKIIATKYGC